MNSILSYLSSAFLTNWKTTSVGILSLAVGAATYFGVGPDPKVTALIGTLLTTFLGVTAQDAIHPPIPNPATPTIQGTT